MVIFEHKMNVFNFLFICVVYLLKNFLRLAEILLALTPSVTPVIAELNR